MAESGGSSWVGHVVTIIGISSAVAGGALWMNSQVQTLGREVRTEVTQLSKELRAEMSLLEVRLGRRIDAVERRVGEVENRLLALETRLDLERRARGQERSEIDRAIAATKQNDRELERRIQMAHLAAQLEHRISSKLMPGTKTVVGTLLSIVPAERVLAVLDTAGRSRGFVIGADLTATAICGATEAAIPLTDLKPGTPVLIAYSPNQRERARLVATSSCP